MHGTFFIMPENWTINGWPFSQWLESEWFENYDWGLSHPMNITHPNQMQFSEWSQQMLATMYQNQWNSEQERMRRMKEAGINPFAAAQGIAGVGGSQGSVAGAPPSAGSGALPQMVDAATNALAASGNTFGQVAQGVSMLSKLRGEIDKIDSETQLNFENLGFSELQSRALSTQLKYMDWKEKMSCFQALANFENTKAEYDILKQDHLNKIAELDKIIADTNVSVSMQEKIEAETQKIAQETAWIKQDVDFWTEHGYMRGSPFYESLRDAAVNGKDIDLNAFGDLVAGYEGKIYFARENAAAQASWNRRPTNAYEASAYIGNSLGKRLKEFFAQYNPAEAMAKVELEPELKDEFEMAYDEARDKLKENYRNAKKEYNKFKNSGNSMTVAELERKKNNAKNELDSFTKEKFSEILVNLCTGKSSIK